MALPPLQRIDAGQKSQSVSPSSRADRQAPQDRETLFWFNVRAFPEVRRRQRPATGHAEPAETVLPSESHYQKQQ
ncbi:fimbria/pilus periplasmic chaperone [Salmonella enterica]|uniref:fimbria/pilus periplasmic chaperone n=1 Tax=Salmonella enterica TaxID=28901 RepID=UPI003D2FC61E